MIARTWRGRTLASKSDEYVDVVKRTGVSAIRATEGNAGVWLLRRIEGEVAYFQVISLWDSMEAIRGFAGPDPERAVYYPEDDAFLLEKDYISRPIADFLAIQYARALAEEDR